MAFDIMSLFSPQAVNRLLQPQQSAQGVQNMLMAAPALPPPVNIGPAPPVAAPPVDTMQTSPVAPQAAPITTPAVPDKPGGLDKFDKDMFRENLNQFFLGMTAGKTPSESLAMGAMLANQKHNSMKNGNQTVAWLQSKGLDKEQAWQIAQNPSVLSEYLKTMFSQQKPLEINGQLVDPKTYKVLADFRTPAAQGEKDTALIRELKAAGLKEGTPEFQEAILANNRPKGMMIESDGQGGFKMVQGTDVSGGANMNVEQGKNTGFLLRAQDADKVITSLENEGTSIWNNTAGHIPKLGNFVRGDNAQKYDQAKRDFINAKMRQESGAVISPEEFQNADVQYFPQPGDSAAVIEQKRRNRQNAIAGFRISSGPGAQSVDKMNAQNAAQDPLGIR